MASTEPLGWSLRFVLGAAMSKASHVPSGRAASRALQRPGIGTGCPLVTHAVHQMSRSIRAPAASRSTVNVLFSGADVFASKGCALSS